MILKKGYLFNVVVCLFIQSNINSKYLVFSLVLLKDVYFAIYSDTFLFGYIYIPSCGGNYL